MLQWLPLLGEPLLVVPEVGSECEYMYQVNDQVRYSYEASNHIDLRGVPQGRFIKAEPDREDEERKGNEHEDFEGCRAAAMAEVQLLFTAVAVEDEGGDSKK